MNSWREGVVTPAILPNRRRPALTAWPESKRAKRAERWGQAAVCGPPVPGWTRSGRLGSGRQGAFAGGRLRRVPGQNPVTRIEQVALDLSRLADEVGDYLGPGCQEGAAVLAFGVAAGD